jgi:hypothetical protein
MQAVYIVIAAILAIAGILTIWISPLVQQNYLERLGISLDLRRNVTGDKPTDICTSASFKFYSGKYDKENMNLYLIFENQRSIELKLEKLYLFYPDSFEEFGINKTLEGNILKSFNIPGVKDGFSSGTIKTSCPNVEADFSYSQLT